MSTDSLRKRLIIILYILSFTASVVLFGFVMRRVSVDVECTSHNQYAIDDNTIYYVQNHKKEGFLFSMNTAGRVSHLFSSKSLSDSRILSVSVRGGKIYLLLQTFIEQKSAEDENAIISIPAYRIVCLDKRLKEETRTAKFRVDDSEVFTGFSAEPTGLFLTFLSEDGSFIRVYSLDPQELVTEPEVVEDDPSLEGVRSKKSEAGRFYSDAIYYEGQLYARTDKSIPEGVFAIDPVVSSIVSGMKLSIGQILSVYSVYIIWYVAALLIWFIVLFLIIRVLVDRNRSFYFILIAEVMLFVIVAIAVFAVSTGYSRARATEHSRFAVTSLISLKEGAGLNEYVDYDNDAYYDSERYLEIKNNLTGFIKNEGNNDIFYDVFVLRLKDNVICASACGRNREVVTDVYGSSMTDIALGIARGQRFVGVDLDIEGQAYRAVAVADDILSADYALVGIINSTTTDATVFVDNIGVFLAFLVTFALASALVVLVWFLHMRDLIVLEQALSDTALGKEMPERPAVLGRDIKDMWDSVAEVNKRIEEIQYSKIRILEAYYRFAPKNVEKVLHKNSIIEVSNGDTRRLSGTVGTFCVDLYGGKKMDRLENIVKVIGEYQKNHESIIIGKAPDMSAIQILFSENENDTVEAFIDIFSRSNKNGTAQNVSVLLCYDECLFGVAGDDNETSTYMYSDNKELIRSMSAFAISVKLGLVISERVLKREKIDGKVRFIGYGGINNTGEMIKLYEVLDACPARVRAERLATMSRFEEALNLFYEKDFYFARTRFSEIIKDTPDDDLAKWYVFESDRFLNEGTDGENYKLLHI